MLVLMINLEFERLSACLVDHEISRYKVSQEDIMFRWLLSIHIFTFASHVYSGES